MFTAILGALGFTRQQHSAGDEPQASPQIGLWRSGYSIRQVTASFNPGAHGPEMLVLQDQLEGDIRHYLGDVIEEMLELREYVEGLERQVAQLRHALDDCARG